MSKRHLFTALLSMSAFAVSCSGKDGIDGASGATGATGAPGATGEPGAPGATGPAGPSGTDGAAGPTGASGVTGPGAKSAPDARYPRSSLVALSFLDDGGTGAKNVAEFVKARVAQYGAGTLPAGVQFPLAHATTDTVRAITGLSINVVVSWLDPLKWDSSAGAPRFGANADYLAYFGDGWSSTAGAPPQWNGSGDAAWMWANHEYVSGTPPTATTAPLGQSAFLAEQLAWWGLIKGDPRGNSWSDTDLARYVERSKREVGGSWIHVVRDPSSGEWTLDRGASNVRYDATSATLTRLTGASLSAPEKTDLGAALPANVVPGIAGNCSGAQTPWGTILSAEENVQDYYGDLEGFWTSDQKLVVGAGADPGGNVAFVYSPSTAGEFGRTPEANARHARDGYGWMVEIDPGKAPDEYEGKTASGDGHKKLGALGRARWENAAFVTDADWKLLPNEPIVFYASDDRRGGRIYKFVSKNVYTTGMTKAQIRALLDEGSVYAAHFAGLDNLTGDTLVGGGAPTEDAPGTGRWIKLGVDSADVAPNAAALGAATKTVGEALKDKSWNGLAGFPTDLDVRRALFTASAKVGVMELNRPEDIEWNPKDPSGRPRIYVAFTNHNRKTALDQSGKLFDPSKFDAESKVRPDRVGSIFAIDESAPSTPGSSTTFKFFRVWKGTSTGSTMGTANPDNLMIDKDGGVWFGTDGAFGAAKTADGLYYLDVDPAHKTAPSGKTATFGMAFRIVAGPSDSEATGPAFSSDMRTLFFDVQHPGEDTFSSWPSR
ncbi:MAG: DUF839 domain-containing protein [Deltaproteobacteria bacterium]|nr:DUF839 domain-containing protein [Deltaproteobacteria bacterium]